MQLVRNPHESISGRSVCFLLTLLCFLFSTAISREANERDLSGYYRLLETITSDSSIDQTAALQTYLEAHPAFERVYFKLSESYLIRGKFDSLKAYFAQLKAHPTYRRNINWALAKGHLSQNDLSQASVAFARALQAGPPPTALVYDLLEFDYQTDGRFHIASLIRNHSSDPEVVNTIEGLRYTINDDFQSALRCLEKLSEKSRSDLFVIHSLGYCQFYLGHYPSADSLWRLGLQRARGSADLEQQAKFLTCIANVSAQSGHNDLAKTHYNSAYTIARRIGDSQRMQIVVASWGNLLTQQGRHESAIKLLCSAIKATNHSVCQSNLSDCYFQLGLSLGSVGRLSEAITAFSDAEKYINPATDAKHRISLMIARADLYSNIKQYAMAKRLYTEAHTKATSKRLESQKREIKAKLADLAILDGDFVKAREIFRQMIDSPTVKSNLASRSYWTWKLADVDRQQGRLTAAKTNLLRALYLAEEAKATLYIAWFRMGVADIESLLGNIDGAIRLYQGSIRTAIENNNLEMIVLGHLNLGNAYYKKKDLATAITEYRQAVRFIERVDKALHAEPVRIGYLEKRNKIFKKLAACFLLRFEQNNDRADLDSLYYWTELSKGQVLKAIRFGREAQQGGKSHEAPDGPYLQAHQRLRDAQRRLRKEATRWRTADEWNQLLADLETAKYSLLEQRLCEADPLADEYHDASFVAQPFANLQAYLARTHCGLLLYSLGEEASFVLAATGDSASVVRLQVNPTSLGRMIDSLMTPFHRVEEHSGFQTEFHADLAHRLYQLLIEPVERTMSLPQRLVIIPDLALANLPMEILLTQPPPKPTYLPTEEHPYARDFLLHRYVFFYNPTAALLQANAMPACAESNMLVLANPFEGKGELADKQVSLRHRTGWRFDPLPFAEIEAEKIKQIRPSAKILSRSNASESFFMQEASQYPLIHIATHAFVDTTFDSFSGLILAAGKDTTEDGILMGYEISALDLNCDLVVLSACETGRGKLVHGEGVLGLPRQFLAAGAETVLMSLWKVDDKFTSELMPAFYEHFLKGRQSKAEALSQAKLTLLNHPTTNSGVHYQHPLFWASFVLFGDPGFEVTPTKKGFDFTVALSLAFMIGLIGAIAAYWTYQNKGRTAAGSKQI